MKKGFALLTMVLILVIAFCTTGTVMGMENGKERMDESGYKQVEKEYVTQVKSYLQKEGYENSGVVLTKVIYEDGSREYTLNVHHKRITKLSETEQEFLRSELIKFAIHQDRISEEILLVVFS